MRAVLLITPYFAPQTHAAMFRVHKLAKYLPAYGWKPIVLTTDTNYLYNENSALLDELPQDVEIHRARYVEPTGRGLRMAMGGKDRTFAATKREGRYSAHTVQREAARRAGPSRLYSRMMKRVAQRPDTYWPWRGPATRMAKRLIQERSIRVIYTTTLPYTTLQIGEALQRSMECRWVADIRDPGTYSHRMSSPHEAVYLHQRRIERRALWKADAVTALSTAYAHIFDDLHGPGLFDRIRFVPTGLDEALIPHGHAGKRGALVLSGEYLTEYGDSFWRILGSALEKKPSLRREVRVSVIGHELLNRKRLTPHLERLGLEEQIEFVDHLPQKDLYVRLANAQAALLVPGSHAHWWTNFAKMVDYIALQRPVLALVPNPSEARKELSRVGLGVFLDGTVDEAAHTLIAFLTGRLQVQPNLETSKDYLASSQVEAFSALFADLSDK